MLRILITADGRPGSETVNDDARKRLPGTIGWGLILWLTGYVLAMVLFAFVPVAVIGWLVSIPLIPFTVLVAYQRLHNVNAPPAYYLLVAGAWLTTALILDYLFIVKAFKVVGYYDLDVGIYYLLTFLLPLVIGWRYGGSHDSFDRANRVREAHS
jgi:hypothetical protein